MTTKRPALVCKIMLLLSFLFLGTNVNAQLDFATAKAITGFNNLEEINSLGIGNNDEILFIDHGTGRLANGRAEIFISPEIANQIEGSRIAEAIIVSIQMEGKSEGVYVSKKDTNTFVITELENGVSNALFSYKFIVTDRQ